MLTSKLRLARKHFGRNNRGSAEIAEFVPVLYILFLLMLMPILDIVSIFVAGATQYLATNDFAAKAATQANYTTALATMATEAYQFQSNGLAKFVHMVPDGGFTGCGDDLFVLATDLGSGNVTSSAANLPLTQTINTQANMYEISVKSVYSVSPLVSLASVPLLGDVPGLGKPATLSFCANRPVEHPGGLNPSQGGNLAGGGSGGGSGAGITPFPRVASNPAAPGLPSNITWRNPGIFEQIAAAGQTVVNVNVLTVQADYGTTVGAANGGWVSSGITVQPGQMVWLDTQATGNWGTLATGTQYDANGGVLDAATTAGGDGRIDGATKYYTLIGWVGSPPILPYGHTNMQTTNPKFIVAGNTLLNYLVTQPGNIMLANNDNQIDDFGSQMVRVIVTQ